MRMVDDEVIGGNWRLTRGNNILLNSVSTVRVPACMVGISYARAQLLKLKRHGLECFPLVDAGCRAWTAVAVNVVVGIGREGNTCIDGMHR